MQFLLLHMESHMREKWQFERGKKQKAYRCHCMVLKAAEMSVTLTLTGDIGTTDKKN